jgi:hypothetical protein
LRRDAGIAEEEEEYAAIHGQRPIDADEEVASRGKKKRTLAQAQAEEPPAEGGRERESRLREDFEVAAQRLQDVTNAFGTRTSLPPLDTNVFGTLSPWEPTMK